MPSYSLNKPAVDRRLADFGGLMIKIILIVTVIVLLFFAIVIYYGADIGPHI